MHDRPGAATVPGPGRGRAPVLGLAAALGAVATAPAAGQGIPFSQRGGVFQRVGYTDITITYSRPVARGRTLFGGVVAWGRTWNPGADSATTIRLSRDVLVEGNPLPSGRYTLWVVPRPDSAWSVVFSRAVDVFHTPYPGEAQDALRVAVAPEAGAHMEVLAFYFPVVARDSAVLRLHWGQTVLPLAIRTTSDEPDS